MTNLEALKFLLGPGSQLSDDEARSYLQFNDVDPDGTWDQSDTTLKCKVYGTALSILDGDNVGITQIREGGYSITYDKDVKARYLENMANDSGCSKLIDKYSSQPKVTDRSYLW